MEGKVIRVLLVEDNATDAALIRESLERAGAGPFQLTHVDCLHAALQHLGNGHVDVVLLDLGLPDSQGLDTVRQMHAATSSVPLVVLTGQSDEAPAFEALKEGAQDYLVKGQADGAVMAHALLTAIERQHQQVMLRGLALIDELTGLHNRRSFLTLAAHHLKVAHRTGRSFLLAFVDLDGLKQINDTFGHPEGDRALVKTAEVLRKSFRQSDILGRLGGDEFAVLMPEADENSAPAMQSRLQENTSACNRLPGRTYALSLSVGILAGFPDQPRPLEELLAQADALMYAQKRHKQAAEQTALRAREKQLG